MSYKKEKKQKKRGTVAAYLLLMLLFVIIGLSGAFVVYYSYGVREATLKSGEIYISSGSTFSEQAAKLLDEGFISDTSDYVRFAKKLGYDRVYPGKYAITEGWPLKTLYRVINTGAQLSVNVPFNNIRNFERLASVVSKRIEADSISLLKVLNSDSVAQKYGFNSETFMSMFIPNTYSLFWSATAEDFVDRMSREYDKFWKANDRDSKAETLGLSRQEVSILASIIIEESKAESEFERIAGVYINRLKANMPLQADPTVKYALGDMTIRRVLYKHLEVDSPYNTYKNGGLPPGPICVPPIAAIDAVLNYEKHKYYYFCASDQLNGLHLFAENLRQHNINAAAYAAALNKRGIR
ncbi:MAG: endolytic transglycosylase MltG [Rikenellaceae bacterium]